MRVMIVAPHPDDEVLGCGGVMARFAAEGSETHVVIVTRGIPELWTDSEVAKTRREMEEANHMLGVTSISCLDFPAPSLDTVPCYKLAEAIKTVIRQYSPDRLFIPHYGDLHADHRAVFAASLVASRPTTDCSVREILCYETLSETDWGPPMESDWFVPTVFVDISDYLDRKVAALKCYHGQIHKWPHPRSLEAVQALARLRGAAIGVNAAESFRLVKSIYR